MTLGDALLDWINVTSAFVASLVWWRASSEAHGQWSARLMSVFFALAGIRLVWRVVLEPYGDPYFAAGSALSTVIMVFAVAAGAQRMTEVRRARRFVCGHGPTGGGDGA